MQHELQRAQQLERRQDQKRQPGMHLAPGVRARRCLNGLLLFRDGNERERHASERDHVAERQRTETDRLAVDLDAALGADV